MNILQQMTMGRRTMKLNELKDYIAAEREKNVELLMSDRTDETVRRIDAIDAVLKVIDEHEQLCNRCYILADRQYCEFCAVECKYRPKEVING